MSAQVSEESARRIVYARADGRCEGCGRPPTDWSHRVGRGVGGLWLPSNGLHLCRQDHQWIHANPTLAALCGWRVESGEHPADVPVWMRSTVLIGWHRLDDDGGIEPLWDRVDVPELPLWVRTEDRVPSGKSQR